MPNDLKAKLENLLQQRYAHELDLLGQLKVLYDESSKTLQQEQPTQPLNTFLRTQLQEPEESQAMYTEFAFLNSLLGGFRPGELVVLGGRPSMGKTQLAINLALQLSVRQPVLYCSYDLTEQTLAARLLAGLSGVSASKIADHHCFQEELERVEKAKLQAEQHQLHCFTGTYSGIDALRLLCEQHIEQHGTKIIVVDYLQMLSSARHRQYREAEVSYISRSLKALAREKKVCVIALSQLSRSVETRGGDKIPQLSDLRESGSIEQDADKVLFIYRPDYYGLEWGMEGEATGNTHLVLAKNRNGHTGTVYLMHDSAFARFTGVEERLFAFNVAINRLKELGFDDVDGASAPF
jgi:replicative DNA helicase